MPITIQYLFNAKRRYKRAITMSYDVFAITLSLYLAISLRLGTPTFPVGADEVASLLVTLFITVVCFIKLGMYRAVLRYMMLPAIGNIFLGVMLSTITLALSSFFFHSFIPRSVPFIYAGLAILSLGGPRIFVRSMYYHLFRKQKPNVFIYGAGATGRELSYALIQGNEYNPVAILDDDPNKKGQILFGIRVYHPDDFEELQLLYQPVK